MWIETSKKKPIELEDITFGSNKQVKVVFAYKGTACMNIGLYTRWNNGAEEWAELNPDGNTFSRIEDLAPDLYIPLPEIP